MIYDILAMPKTIQLKIELKKYKKKTQQQQQNINYQTHIIDMYVSQYIYIYV